MALAFAAIAQTAKPEKILLTVDQSSLTYINVSDYYTDSAPILRDPQVCAYIGDLKEKRAYAVTYFDEVRDRTPPREELMFHEASWYGPAPSQMFRFPKICYEGPACRGCRGPAKMARSYDGRYVFTMIERRQEHHQRPPPGVVANDDDASFDEQIVIPFNVTTSIFLPPTVVNWGQPLRYEILPAEQANHFLIIVNGWEKNIRLLDYQMNALDEPPRQPVELGTIAVPDSFWQALFDSEHHRMLLVFQDGTVLEVSTRGSMKQLGSIPAFRNALPTKLSGDGNLLFVMTNPATAANEIAVYNANSLRLIRTMKSQRPLTHLVPDYDGSSFYATAPATAPASPALLALTR